MGSRANLILFEYDRYDLYYCHWCAGDLPYSIFWGPEPAAAFIRQQKEVAADGWLDTVWAEGGVVLDRDHRTLIVWGGDDLRFDILLRRLYLALVRQVWAGWEIHWADKGIVDIAEYVEFPRGQVVAQSADSGGLLSLDPPGPLENGFVHDIGSVRFEDGSLRIFPLDGDTADRLCCGPALLELARASPGLDALDLSQQDGFPRSGFHLDAAANQLMYWSSGDIQIEALIAERWPGWEARWLRDGYEEHVRLLEGRLRLAEPAFPRLIEWLRALLLADNGGDPRDTLRWLAEDAAEKGQAFTVNPDALQYAPQRLPPEIKAAIWERALAGWRAAGGSEG